jgi:hypothetical protein
MTNSYVNWGSYKYKFLKKNLIYIPIIDSDINEDGIFNCILGWVHVD